MYPSCSTQNIVNKVWGLREPASDLVVFNWICAFPPTKWQYIKKTKSCFPKTQAAKADSFFL